MRWAARPRTPPFGLTRNPWDITRIPGGSSGGSAAAWRRRIIAALGSDTGGSIRQPAALCGCVGLKPSYGRVSRYGLVAFASSLDQIGPFTKTVEDAAIILQVMAGLDPLRFHQRRRAGAGLPRRSDGRRQGLKLGMPKEYLATAVDPEVRKAVDAAIKQLAARGAEIVEISLPHTEHAVATYYIIATAEASHQPGALRWHPLRLPAWTAATPRSLRQTARRRIRPGSQTPHHPRHLRAEQRLLRRLLRPRAESPHADPQGFLKAFQEGRCHRYAGLAHCGLQKRRKIRMIRCRCISRTFSRSPPTSRASPASPSLRLYAIAQAAHRPATCSASRSARKRF